MACSSISTGNALQEEIYFMTLFSNGLWGAVLSWQWVSKNWVCIEDPGPPHCIYILLYYFTSSHSQNQNMLCINQRGKCLCKTEDSCFHNRNHCTLHQRTKLVVKTVIKTNRQQNMTHLGTAASQAYGPWILFKNLHLHFLNSKHRRRNY